MLPPNELNALQRAAQAAMPTALVTTDSFAAKREFQKLAKPAAILALIEGTRHMAIEVMRLLGLPQWLSTPAHELPPAVYIVWSDAWSQGTPPTLAAWTGEEFQHLSGQTIEGVTHHIATDIPYAPPQAQTAA